MHTNHMLTDPLSASIIKKLSDSDWTFTCHGNQVGVFHMFQHFEQHSSDWHKSLNAEEIALVNDPAWRHCFLEAYNHCSNLVNKWKKRPFLVRFLDGDRQNVKLSNLAFVTFERALEERWTVDFETGLSQDEISASKTLIFTLPVVLDPLWSCKDCLPQRILRKWERRGGFCKRFFDNKTTTLVTIQDAVLHLREWNTDYDKDLTTQEVQFVEACYT